MMLQGVKEGAVPRSSGFTLVESLVAVLVLSIGLLGMAAMQLKSLQSSHISYQRTIATLAAQDAVERLWISLGEATVHACPAADIPDPDAEGELVEVNSAFLDQWKEDWGAHLELRTVATLEVLPASCTYQIVVGWEDARFNGESQAVNDGGQGLSTLHYRVKLPKRTI